MIEVLGDPVVLADAPTAVAPVDRLRAVQGPPLDEGPTPIDEWLRRQQDLTAVERFSAAHADLALAPGARWRDRLPATAPGPGEQYGFDVDLDSCTGCKACVAACHSLNGIDDGESWRRVGSLHDGAPGSGGGIMTVTSSCHHCVEPACLIGCPAQAYEKDPATGIVRHLDDACIGCSYCTLMCPYEVPLYNADLGIVRKCDMCADRLAEGDAPACVQGCPQGAITISLVRPEDLVAAARAVDPSSAAARLVPGAAASSLTVPTTRYRSRRPLQDTWVAADQASIHPSHGHTPLAVMLVLTQIAVGVTAVGAVVRASVALAGHTDATLTVVGLVTAFVALGASVLHLGRPLLAWRAVLGLRRSWLSREIVAFGGFAGAAASYPLFLALGLPDGWAAAASWASVGAGVVAVGCSAALYAVTGRRWWRMRTTMSRFAATVLVGGALGVATILSLVEPDRPGHVVDRLLLLAGAVIVASTFAPYLPLARAHHGELVATRRLLAGELRNRFQARVGGAFVALVILGLVLGGVPAGGGRAPGIALALAMVAWALAEFQERRLFFLASVAPRLPGQPR